MSHLSEEDLILHYYDEAEDALATSSHLEACAECRAELHSLRRVLTAADAASVPDPGPGWDARVWRGLATRLRRPAWRSPRHWGAWAGLAASLVTAFWIGRQFPSRPAPVRERILLVAVGDHLERSQMVLAELVNAHGAGPADIRTEQQWAVTLVPSNHLLRQAALRSGDAALAGVLEDLGRVLVEIANGPSELSARELAEVRQRIETQGILFKVKVVERQVREKSRRAPARPKDLAS